MGRTGEDVARLLQVIAGANPEVPFGRKAEPYGDLLHDAVTLPSAQVWPFPVDWRWPHFINGLPMDTYHRWMEVVIPISMAGLRCLSIPVGFGPQGLLMGVQIAGSVGADAKLLAIGQAYHLATDWLAHRPPIRPVG